MHLLLFLRKLTLMKKCSGACLLASLLSVKKMILLFHQTCGTGLLCWKVPSCYMTCQTSALPLHTYLAYCMSWTLIIRKRWSSHEANQTVFSELGSLKKKCLLWLLMWKPTLCFLPVLVYCSWCSYRLSFSSLALCSSRTILKKKNIYCIYFSGGPLSALTAALTQNFYRAIKKISPLIYFQTLPCSDPSCDWTNQELEFRMR